MRPRLKTCALLAAATIVVSLPARAQNAAAPSVGPSQEALTLSRTLVEKSGIGGQSALNGLVLPLPQFLAGLGVTQPQQVQALAHDVIMPTLTDHDGDLTDIAVKSVATLLSVPEMKAAIAFYDSPAGRNFVRLKYRVTQDNVAASAAAISALRPEVNVQVKAVAQAHGWPPN